MKVCAIFGLAEQRRDEEEGVSVDVLLAANRDEHKAN